MKPTSLLLLPVAAALLSLAGCPPCKQTCVAEADVYAMCLGEWGMTWTDAGYAGVEEYEAVCKDEAELERLRQGDDAAKIAYDNACVRRNRMLRSTDDCAALYDELSALSPDAD